MTEQEARDVVAALVTGAGMDRLGKLVDLVVAENDRQNLVARSTVPVIWRRHVLDSVQLLSWARDGLWLDIGTGGGFPGLAIACVSDRPMLLAEPRRRRAAFLADAAASLDVKAVEVVQRRVEAIPRVAVQVISARAVSSLDALFRSGMHCAEIATCWLLPRGAGFAQEVAEVRRDWAGMFHVEQSLSDATAGVVVATGVVAR